MGTARILLHGCIFLGTMLYTAWRMEPPLDMDRQQLWRVCYAVEIEKIDQKPGHGKAYGYGRIIEAKNVHKLVGHRVYFYLNGSEHYIPSQVLKLRSDIRILKSDKTKPSADEHFFQYLVQKNINLYAYRGEVLTVEQPASWIADFFDRIRTIFHASLGSASQRLGIDSSDGILYGMLLSEKKELTALQKEQFHNTGVAHLLAVSGLHIGMIALALEFLCKCCFLKKTGRRSLIACILFFYIGAIGFPPSAVRAWMMLICFWMAPVLNRQSSGMSSLLCSALLALIHNPMVLFDIGFQLSYGVVAMILLCSEVLCRRKKKILSLLSVSIAATLASAPLTFEYFSMFSLVGIFINPLVVQLAMPAVASGFLFLLGSLCGENRLSDICFGIARCLTKILELFLNIVEQWMPWHIEWATKPKFLGLLMFLCFLVIGFWISWYAQFRQWSRVHAEKR